MSSTRNEKKTLINLSQQTSERCLNASSELDQLRQENEFLKIENEQLKRQIEQVKELNRKPNDRIDTLEEIKKLMAEPSLAPSALSTLVTIHW